MRSLLLLALFLCFSHIMLGQSSHLSLIYDFPGEDFENSVSGMLGANDSLYIITYQPGGKSSFFRIDENGEGYKLIWEFDDVNYEPSSIVGNDTVIYITTHANPSLFKYSLQDYSFELVKTFDFQDVHSIQIKYITDSVLWLTSQGSWVDEGSIFTINPDGSSLQKIYNDTNEEKGQNPVDFVFHEGKIYIACYNGGGPLHTIPGTSGTYSSGCVIRINADGTGYENIIPGGSHVGTQPSSLVVRGDKLFGSFAYSFNQFLGAQYFRSNLDGTVYDSLGGFPERTLTKMLSTDSLIYSFTSVSVIGINPVTGEMRVSNDLLSDPDFGNDVTASPAYLNGGVFISTQQGGPNGGGTILKWINKSPEIDEAFVHASGGRLRNAQAEIDLNELFLDPEGDLLTFGWAYNEAYVTVTESNGVLTLTALIAEEVNVNITARDGWAGRKTITLTLNTDGTFIITGVDEREVAFYLYPNPTQSILKFSSSNVRSIDVVGLDGKICASFLNPKEEIDISSLRNGTYFVRCYLNGNFYVQKIIKH